jgi:hypothetical protein
VVTTATIDALGAAHPAGAVDANRFRPNVVIRMIDGRAFEENGWPGRTLVTGDATLRVMTPTPRCVVPTLDHGNGADPEVLRTAARSNRVQVLDIGVLTCVGAYASVDRPGTLRIGDLVRVI